jgi:hypothetical protein
MMKGKSMDIDYGKLANPIIASQLLAAFYSALLYEKQSGKEITPLIENQIWLDIFQRWNKTVIFLDKLGQLGPANMQQPPWNQ